MAEFADPAEHVGICRACCGRESASGIGVGRGLICGISRVCVVAGRRDSVFARDGVAASLGLSVIAYALHAAETGHRLQPSDAAVAANSHPTGGRNVVRGGLRGDARPVAGHSIAVVEACDGIRYLLPLAFLALVFAYAAGAKSWMRAAMLAAAIPTAILANALRVAFSGLSPMLTDGTPHALLGTFIFVLCLGLQA